MATSYDSWATRDDGDDLGAMEAGEPTWYVVTCVQCQELFEVRQDDYPPYRCATCCERNAAEKERL